MAWNTAAYRLIGEPGPQLPEALRRLAELELWLGSRLPAAVREWFDAGSDERLAERVDNLLVRVAELGKPADGLDFASAGFLLLATDSQYCCRWVVPVGGVSEDPPVYLIDPADQACGSRTRYADRFTSFVHTVAWDASLWSDAATSMDFDHVLDAGALARLRVELTQLPTTYGWAANQGCDAVYRFDGAARVALAVSGEMAVWSAVATPSPPLRSSLVELIGASL